MRGAGVVDDDVDPPERGNCFAGRALDVAAVRNVAVKRDRTAAEPLGGRLGDVALEVQARHPRALPNEGFGDAEAEPLARSGHQRGFALQTHSSASSPVRRTRPQPALRRAAASSSSISRARWAAGRDPTSDQ